MNINSNPYKRRRFWVNGVPTESKRLEKEYINYTTEILNKLFEHKKSVFENALNVKLDQKSFSNLYRDSQKRRSIDKYSYKGKIESKVGFGIRKETYNSLIEDINKTI